MQGLQGAATLSRARGVQVSCSLQPRGPLRWGAHGGWLFSFPFPVAPPICPPESPVWGLGMVPNHWGHGTPPGLLLASQRPLLSSWSGLDQRVRWAERARATARLPRDQAAVSFTLAQLTWGAGPTGSLGKTMLVWEEVGLGVSASAPPAARRGPALGLELPGAGDPPQVPMAGTQWALQKGPSG